jgi:hypothetical protein
LTDSVENRSTTTGRGWRSALIVFNRYVGNVAFWPGVLGVIGAQIDLVSPIVAFAGYAITVLLGCLTLLASAATFATSRGVDDSEARDVAKLGLITGGLIALVGIASIFPGMSAPRINDITTNFDEPPEFLAARAAAGLEPVDMSYPEEFVAIAREHYPELRTAEVQMPAYMAVYRAARAAEALGWQVVVDSAALGSVEARATSHIFRFVDDISIRVRENGPDSGSALVDIRSRSRVGRSDLGANAARVRRFLEKL